MDNLDLMLGEEQIKSLPCISLANKDLMPDKSGIYFVFGVTEAQEKRLLYIGKARSLKKRWSGTHHRYRDLQVIEAAGINIYISWLSLLASDEFILGLEARLIREFKPPLNNFYAITEKLEKASAPHPAIQIVERLQNPQKKREPKQVFNLNECSFDDVFNYAIRNEYPIFELLGEDDRVKMFQYLRDSKNWGKVKMIEFGFGVIKSGSSTRYSQACDHYSVLAEKAGIPPLLNILGEPIVEVQEGND